MPNPIQAIINFVSQLGLLRRIFVARFKSLTKRGKFIVSVQLFAMSMILGISFKQVLDFRTSASTSKAGVTRMASKPTEIYYSSFLDLLDKSGKGHVSGENPAIEVENVQIGRDKIVFRVKQDEELHALALQQKSLVASSDVAVKEIEPRDVYVTKVHAEQSLIDNLRKNNIPFRALSNKTSQTAAIAARSAIVAFYMFFLLRMYRVLNQQNGKGETPGKLASGAEMPLVRFEEIEGIDKAKYEVMELVDTLRNPQKYTLVGARPPTGLLLVGPPGTGKTMLAKATAATAGVPLLYCSGSDFVEMFVGRGASRVRKTFAKAAKLAPCIIFIDEIDALGKSRDRGGLRMQSNDEAEQTLNQLLACMDGLDTAKGGVIVLAATNRREVLDQALVRPGRFDRIIQLELPGLEGRERILRVHANKLRGFTEGKGVDEKRPGSLGVNGRVDISAVAAITRDLSGAELEFIVNEAAIRAVRRVGALMRAGKDVSQIAPRITPEDFEASVENFFTTRKPAGRKGLIENVFGNIS